MCVLTRKSESQIRVQRNKNQRSVTFLKNHASNCMKIKSQQIANVKGRLSWDIFNFFRILILCCMFTFILIVSVVIEFTFVLFPQPRDCLLMYSWGKHKSRGCYPVATLAVLSIIFRLFDLDNIRNRMVQDILDNEMYNLK